MSETSIAFDSLEAGTVALLGVPLDENSTFLRGPALAPPRIREALYGGSANLCAENDLDLQGHHDWADVGDLAIGSGQQARREIEGAVAALLDRGAYALTLGGDHSITYPIMCAYAGRFSELSILQLDAHSDLYDEFEGDRFAHACPFARIMEEGLVERLVQIGIRTMNPHQRGQAERFGVEVIEMRDWQPSLLPAFDGPVYLSLDMDALDPAYAPGVSHHEPGGLSTRDVIGIIQNLDADLVGADVVELNPVRDPVGITAMAAAKFVKEILARMI